MSFRKAFSEALQGVGNAAQGGAAAIALQTAMSSAEHRFNAAWERMQNAYPKAETDHEEVRSLLVQMKDGVEQKQVATIDAATARLEAIIKKQTTN